MDGRIKRVCGWWLAVLVLAAPVAAAQDFSLVEAVREGDRETVRSLLQQQADVKSLSAGWYNGSALGGPP